MLRSLSAAGLAATLLLAGVVATGAGREEPRAPVGERPPPVHVAGHISSPDGGPVAGARVSVDGRSGSARSGRDGAYLLTVEARPGETLTVRAHHPGLGSATVRVEVAGASLRVDLVLGRVEADAGSGGRETRTAGERELLAPGPSQPGVALESRLFDAAAARAPVHGLPPGFDTEAYDPIFENGWRSPLHAPLSTFSIDVDRASYANVRRFIREGRLPPKDAVRIEEMVNYFPYADAEPSGDRPFAVHTEVGPAPWNPRHRLVRIGLQGRRIEAGELPPSNLVFLVDVSGSMRTPDKLPLLKRSLRLLVDRMREQDRVALVSYAGAAGLVLPPTSGDRREEILEALERLEAGGSTAGGAGLRLAYRVARTHFRPDGINRVVLATDGDFNVGASSDAEMVRLVEEEREAGVDLSVLGFGTGNLKDSKMEKLADHGNGNYAYVDGLAEARKVLVAEMGGTLVTIARDVKVQVEPNPARVAAYRLIGYENRMLAAEDFDDDARDAGELGAGHAVTALYEVVPQGVPLDVDVGGVDPLRYQTPRDTAPSGFEDELLHVKLRYKGPDGGSSTLLRHVVGDDGATDLSSDLGFAAAVAGFGMILSGSEHVEGWGLDDVLALAGRSLGEDPGGYRNEFLELVRDGRELAGEEGVAGR